MASILPFNFENCKRNERLLSKNSASELKMTKTGTTIAAAVFKNGIVVGADTRATSGTTVSQKNILKISKLAPNVVSAGCGVAADMQHLSKMIETKLTLLRMNMDDRQTRVVAPLRMLKQLLFNYQGYLQVYFIVAGVDVNGPQLYQVSAHGSTMKAPFLSDGSGCLAAMAILEDRWKPDMELEECKNLVADAIQSGIIHDMGSGSNVDLVVVTLDSLQVLRPFRQIASTQKLLSDYTPKVGTTEILPKKRIL